MERQLAELATGLLARGGEVIVVARRCELPAHPRLRWVRVRGPRRPFSLWYPWFFLFGSLAVWRARRGLVHTTGALVLNRADVSTVHFCHRAFHARARVGRASGSSPFYRLNARLAGAMSRLAERYCYRPSRSRRLIAVSQGVAKELAEFFPSMSGAVEVIPNGVDRGVFTPDADARSRLRAEWGIGEGELVALFVGGEWERKGLRHAIEALSGAPAWHLVVVGSGDQQSYGELARRLGVEQRLRFSGRTQDTAPYYAAVDGFLFPTAYEAFSLATLEAASAGLPLLVSRVSGAEELLAEGRNGWFIERDAAAIAGRLNELAADEGLRRAMGEAARADSARFDWPSVVEAYDATYRQMAMLPRQERPPRSVL
jgi:glycosyltransferase involved in cell wall biosynthesis